MASRSTRIKRAQRVLRAAGYIIPGRIVAEVLKAAGPPKSLGAKEVAEAFSTTVPNLRKTNLPEPHDEVAATRLWDEDEIHRAARERERKRIGRGGKAPHAANKKRRA